MTTRRAIISWWSSFRNGEYIRMLDCTCFWTRFFRCLYRFDKNDMLRVVRALAIFRPSLIALQTPLAEEDEIFVERCFQRSLVVRINHQMIIQSTKWRISSSGIGKTDIIQWHTYRGVETDRRNLPCWTWILSIDRMEKGGAGQCQWRKVHLWGQYPSRCHSTCPSHCLP